MPTLLLTKVIENLHLLSDSYTIYFSAILTLAIVDLLYGIFVSPFFVENYVRLHWDQSDGYCKFFEFYFTFHDFFAPLVLILLSIYISLKFAGKRMKIYCIDDVLFCTFVLYLFCFLCPGATGILFRSKKTMYIALFAICLLFSLFLSIPATIKSAIFLDDPPGPDPLKKECRTLDAYTMVLSYFLASSILFCFTMSFLFSLCIVGSPFLRDVIDSEEYSQR